MATSNSRIKTFRPKKLPLKTLHWKKLVPYLGKAHRIIEHFDDILEDLPIQVFTLLKFEESIHSIHKFKATIEKVLCPEKDPHRIPVVLNYLKALEFGMKKGIQRPFSTQFILNLHRLVKSPSLKKKKDIGHLRDRQNWIGLEGTPIEQARFYPPKASVVPRYMNNLKAYLSYDEKDPLVQLAIYFAQFLAIHPFMDGNGRVARILLPLFLCHKKLTSKPLFFLSGYFNKYYGLYFEKLFELSEKENWETWIIFFLKGIIEEGKHNCKRAKHLVGVYKKWKEILSKKFTQRDVEKSLLFFFSHPIFKGDQFIATTQSNLDKMIKVLKLEKKDDYIFCTKILKTRG